MKRPNGYEAAWPWIVRLAGLAFAAHEVLLTHEDRASVLLLASGMVFFKNILDFQRKDGGGS
jgi:hypothetical protein